MALGGYTAMSDLRDLIAQTSNVSSLPTVELIYDEKVVGLVDDQQENIFIKLDGEGIQYYLHGDDTFHTIQLSIEVWTRVSLDRLNDLVSGIFAYIKSNIRFVAPSTSNQYCDLMVVGNHPQSDKYRNIYKHTIDVQLRRLNP